MEHIKYNILVNDNKSINAPLTAVIVGAGHRSQQYASYALKNPGSLKIVGIAEPNKFRRQKTAEMFSIPDINCFESAEELAVRKPIAQTAINGTMDAVHVATSRLLLEAGYDILLEKPICTDKEGLKELYIAIKNTKKKVMVCHVLRYAPFYSEIYKKLSSGIIGDIINIQTVEHVSYHHMTVGYVRGKWNNKATCKSSMLMAKCCHDLDLITWYKKGIRPVRVSSFGGLMQFKENMAPPGSGARCLVDCPSEIEEGCLYSARKIYLNHPDRWSYYVWSYIEDEDDKTIERKTRSLSEDNPHGRCVWKCDNDVVDHQSVLIEFEDGSTATHNMIGGTSRPCRKVHIIGTKGEIDGVFEDNRFTIWYPDPNPGCEYKSIDINVKTTKEGHNGGDERLMEDFVNYMLNQGTSMSTTTFEDSIYGHLIGFNADNSMESGCINAIQRIDDWSL